MSFSGFKYFVTRFHIFQRVSLCWICTTPGWDKCMQNFRKEVTSKFISLIERIILRGIWMNYSMITWAELLHLRLGPFAGYCEHWWIFHFQKSRWLYSPLEPPSSSEVGLCSMALFSLHFAVLDVRSKIVC